MKPKKIRVTESKSDFTTTGRIYDVLEWCGEIPCIEDDSEGETNLSLSKWEPVSEFNHGDPVWSFDGGFNKYKAVYIGKSNYRNDHVVEYKHDGIIRVDYASRIEHRKKMTLQELADKADVNLDEVEIVD